MRSQKSKVAFIFLLAIFRFETGIAQISPGELSKWHEELEGISNCARCHDVKEGLSGDRCLDCHGEIKVQLDNKKGLHWRIREGEKGKGCGFCHSEHNGREFELIYWDEGIENFEHDQTGFALEGRHSAKKCRDCHRPDYILKTIRDQNPDLDTERTFLGLERRCTACHQDIHLAQFKRGCIECHGMESWRPALLFTHDRASYSLGGKHLSVPCGKCHKNALGGVSLEQTVAYIQYVGLRYDDCSDCHEYRHRTELGGRCDGCHTSDGWQSIDMKGFNHGKTRFVLRGRHTTITCESCHRDNRGAPMQFERCDNCHRDIHLPGFRSERYAGSCETCHGEDSFIPSTFGLGEHDQSYYPLTGAHRAVPCTDCHRKESGSDLITFRLGSEDCTECHRDNHQGQFRQERGYTGCASCHNTSRWDSLDFDHQVTDFPLDGRHINVRCEACHPMALTTGGEEYVRYTSLDRRCRDCHGDTYAGPAEEDSRIIGGSNHE